MNKTVAILTLIISSSMLSGCDLLNREQEVERRATALNKREMELNQRETLLREEQIQLDSMAHLQKIDTASSNYTLLLGSWNVKMICTETNCPGSAIGDTKTEQWEFVKQDNILLAIALSNNKLSRIYTGDFSNEEIRMEAQSDSTTKILIRAKFSKDKILTGTREIIREDDCHITYDLTMKK